MATAFAPNEPSRHTDSSAFPTRTIEKLPLARGVGAVRICSISEHSTMDCNGGVGNCHANRCVADPVAIAFHPTSAAFSGESTPAASPGEDATVLPRVSEAEREYLEGLDFEQALIHRCRSLGMIPLDFLHWDPELLDHASATPKPRYFLVMKRAVDIFGALVIGLLLLPLIPFIALAIKLDTPGPMIYSQTRLGQGGKPFRLYKFRTMCEDAERAGPMWASTNDPRITRVGHILRKTRIDEIPQLWNVLIGEMSLIGPRPERPEMLEKIQAVAPEFTMRTAVKPGLTGWAQTVYHYAGTVEEFQRKLEYDLFYIEFDDVLMENLIALRTIKTILLGEGR